MKQAILFVFFLCIFLPVFSQHIKDTESATHGDSAASYEIVNIYNYPGFKVVQFNLAVLSHYSYMLISGNETLVVDPGRDVFTYLEFAKKENLKVQGVLLTHSHADFVAGHIELKKMADCPIYVNQASNVGYECKTMQEGSELTLGEAVIRFVETPGHTPDGMCLYVYNAKKKDSPVLLFTGDTLFVGSVGRPDLLEGKMSASSLASMMFDTWNNKLSKLDDAVFIFPAHGAGSLCGAHLSDKPFSTIGEEKVSNSYLQFKGRSEFIAAILDGLPEAPQYFKYNAALNKQGPELIVWQHVPAEITPSLDLTQADKVYVADIRDAKAYAAGHIANSVNIGVRGRFETWTGIMVPWGGKLVLCGHPEELKEAVYRLHRVGYKADVIDIENWKKAQLTLIQKKLMKPVDLYQAMQKGDAPIIVDVRLPNEWMALRIGTVVNMPLNHLSELSSKLDTQQPVVAVCNSAYRSSMAVGILERKGFQNVMSLDGGSEAWIEAGLPVYKSTKEGEKAKTDAKRQIVLPDRISASDLKRLIMDLPGTFELVDIRPAEHFADFKIPESQNVDIAELIYNPAYLTGAGPLIIVDRDGSLAMAVAGILSQKTKRPIKALYGGVEAYWEQSELLPMVNPGVKSSGNIQAPTSKNIPPPKTPEKNKPAEEQKPPKKKSAGC